MGSNLSLFVKLLNNVSDKIIKKRVYFRMMLQKVKPTNASRRQLIKLNNKGLNLSKKPLLKNSIVVKKKYRKVSFDRRHSSTAVVCTIEHDPNRNTYISSVFDFINKIFFYILTPQNLKVGDIVKSGLKIEPS